MIPCHFHEIFQNIRLSVKSSIYFKDWPPDVAIKLSCYSKNNATWRFFWSKFKENKLSPIRTKLLCKLKDLLTLQPLCQKTKTLVVKSFGRGCIIPLSLTASLLLPKRSCYDNFECAVADSTNYVILFTKKADLKPLKVQRSCTQRPLH